MKKLFKVFDLLGGVNKILRLPCRTTSHPLQALTAYIATPPGGRHNKGAHTVLVPPKKIKPVMSSSEETHKFIFSFNLCDTFFKTVIRSKC